MSFLVKDHPLCQWTCTTSLVVSYQSEWYSECSPFSRSLYLVIFTFHFRHGISFRDCLSCSRVHSFAISPPDVVITTGDTPNDQAFYFQGSGFPLSFSVTWSGFICRVYVNLWELWAVAPMLCRKAFQLSGKVVALYLNNGTAKALCNQGGTAFSLFRLACHILNLADKHGVTPIPAYIYTHLNVEADYLACRRLVPKWNLLPHIA